MLSEKLKNCIKVALAEKPEAEEMISILETSQGADHTHANMTILDATEESFTTVLKTGYDNMVANGLTKNAINGTFVTADLTPQTITVVDGQITSIV